MTLAEKLLNTARAKGIMIATAESCTGGMIAAAITDIPGSSAIFDRGFVTYSNAAKIAMLGVREDTLATHGAVSEPVAREMVAGALARSEASIAVAVTGVAGPGGTDAKPEGMVCFGLATADWNHVETRYFGPIGRDAVRRATVEHALTLLCARIDSLSLQN